MSTATKAKPVWLEIVGKPCHACGGVLLIAPLPDFPELCWNKCEKCNSYWIGYDLSEVETRPRQQLNLFQAVSK